MTSLLISICSAVGRSSFAGSFLERLASACISSFCCSDLDRLEAFTRKTWRLSAPSAPLWQDAETLLFPNVTCLKSMRLAAQMFEKFTLIGSDVVYLNIQSISSIRARDQVCDVTMDSGHEFVVAELADDLVRRVKGLLAIETSVAAGPPSRTADQRK